VKPSLFAHVHLLDFPSHTTPFFTSPIEFTCHNSFLSMYLRHLPIVLLCCIMLSACGNNTTANNSGHTEQTSENQGGLSKSPVALPTACYKKLQGTVGNGVALTMHLVKHDSALSGVCYYDKVVLPVNIEGFVEKDLRLTLYETDAAYESKGLYEGMFSSAEVFEGQWTDAVTKEVLPFKLAEVREGVPAIAFEDYREEDCTNRDRNMKHPKPEGEAWHTDTLCSYIALHVPKVGTGDEAVDKAINSAIQKEVAHYWDKQYPTVEAYLKSIHRLKADEYLSLDRDCPVITVEDDVMTIEFFTFEYGGGAHPLGGTSHLNFDLKTGKVLRLADILVANGKAKLDKIGRRIYKGEGYVEGLEDDDNFFQPDGFKLLENFSITPGGLRFYYNPYEIASYAEGPQEVFIPYEEMEGLRAKP
jgi:hypothetical protein